MARLWERLREMPLFWCAAFVVCVNLAYFIANSLLLIPCVLAILMIGVARINQREAKAHERNEGTRAFEWLLRQCELAEADWLRKQWHWVYKAGTAEIPKHPSVLAVEASLKPITVDSLNEEIVRTVRAIRETSPEPETPAYYEQTDQTGRVVRRIPPGELLAQKRAELEEELREYRRRMDGKITTYDDVIRLKQLAAELDETSYEFAKRRLMEQLRASLSVPGAHVTPEHKQQVVVYDGAEEVVLWDRAQLTEDQRRLTEDYSRFQGGF